MKRVFLIVLDSFGIGQMPDAAAYGDINVNTLGSVSKSPFFHMENMKNMGLFNIDGVEVGEKTDHPTAAYTRMTERSRGKDTTIGHWEIAGIYSPKPLPTYPDGFPEDVLEEFRIRTGRDVLCNKPYSGTQVIADYGDEHVRTGKLIVYTSADSVFQIAAHEDVVPVEQLYDYCRIARQILQGEHGVGRVIARPFIGESGHYTRTPRRHDFSLLPPAVTMLDQLKAAGKDVIAVGKIQDIFVGRGMYTLPAMRKALSGHWNIWTRISKDSALSIWWITTCSTAIEEMWTAMRRHWLILMKSCRKSRHT